jgi:hypothetical protein
MTDHQVATICVLVFCLTVFGLIGLDKYNEHLERMAKIECNKNE